MRWLFVLLFFRSCRFSIVMQYQWQPHKNGNDNHSVKPLLLLLFISPLFFITKLSSAFWVCCIYSSAPLRNIFIILLLGTRGQYVGQLCPLPLPQNGSQCFEDLLEIESQYDQEIPQSQTADNPKAPRGRAAQPPRDHETPGRQIKTTRSLQQPKDLWLLKQPRGRAISAPKFVVWFLLDLYSTSLHWFFL